MKKSLLALAALASVASVAHAEDGVQLYGVLDAGIGYIDRSASASSNFPATVNPTVATTTTATGPVTGMFNGGISPSRWGIKGSEDLGNGRKAFFVLENGFNLPTGQINNGAAGIANGGQGGTYTNIDTSLNGQLFDRQANFGVSDSKLGSIAMGRNYSVLFDIVTANDPVQAAQLFSPIGFSGTTGGGGGTTDSLRVDNSLKYKNQIGKVKVEALYKFGGVSGNSSAQTGYGLLAGYDGGRFSIDGGYEAYKDATAIASSSTSATTTAATSNGVTTYTTTLNNLNGLNATVFNTSAWMLAGKFKATQELTLRAGYQAMTRSAPSDQQTSVTEYGYTFTTTGTGGAGSLYNYVGTNINYKIYWVGGDYNVTPKFNVAVGAYDVKNDAYVGTYKGVNNTSVGDTDQKFYSLLLDYSISKRTDAYAGWMQNQPSGIAGTGTTVNIYALGLRHKF